MNNFTNAGPSGPVIKVIGVGGIGCNAVQHMIENGIEGVQYICIDTDKSMLDSMSAKSKIFINRHDEEHNNLDPFIDANKQRIRTLLEKTDLAFIIASISDDTGLKIAPTIAQLAKDNNILTLGIFTQTSESKHLVSSPFQQQAHDQLSRYVDTLITIPVESTINSQPLVNSILEAITRAKYLLHTAFQELANGICNTAYSYLGNISSNSNSMRVDATSTFIPVVHNLTPVEKTREAANPDQATQVIYKLVQSISELITIEGLICLDFADIRPITFEMGKAAFGLGKAHGNGRVKAALTAALSCPYLSSADIKSAKGIIVAVSASSTLSINELDDAGETIYETFPNDANVIIGGNTDLSLEHEAVSITVLITGLEKDKHTHETISNLPRLSGSISYSELKYPKTQQD